MNLILKSEVRDEIVKVIANSNLPTIQGVGIINALNSLEAIKEEKNNMSIFDSKPIKYNSNTYGKKLTQTGPQSKAPRMSIAPKPKGQLSQRDQYKKAMESAYKKAKEDGKLGVGWGGN